METESTPLKTYEAGVAVVGTPLMSGLILHKEPKTQQSDNGVQFQILGARLCAGPRGCQPLSSHPPPHSLSRAAGDEAQCVEVMLQPGQIMRRRLHFLTRPATPCKFQLSPPLHIGWSQARWCTCTSRLCPRLVPTEAAARRARAAAAPVGRCSA